MGRGEGLIRYAPRRNGAGHYFAWGGCALLTTTFIRQFLLTTSNSKQGVGRGEEEGIGYVRFLASKQRCQYAFADFASLPLSH